MDLLKWKHGVFIPPASSASEKLSPSSSPQLGAWAKPPCLLQSSTSHQTNEEKVSADASSDVQWPSLSDGKLLSQNRKKSTIVKGPRAQPNKFAPPSHPSSQFVAASSVAEAIVDEEKRFPWAAKMNPTTRNLFRATNPSYMEDGTPQVTIPSHVFLEGIENQKEYILGQFYRCNAPPGGLIHAVVNHIWGRNCRIFSRKLSDSTCLFHIPDEATRSWILQRSLWHVDDCLMFVAPWSPTTSLELPEISTVPVWVTLKNIPPTLYSIKALSWIASGVGEPMLSYKPRLDPTEIGKAKVMVEIELSKNFPQKVAARDVEGNVSMVDVEYSWIPSKCEGCGHLGHKISRCLLPTHQHQHISNKNPPAPVNSIPDQSDIVSSTMPKNNSLLESQELVNVVSKNIVMEDSMTHTAIPNVEITPTEVANTTKPAEIEETMIAPPTTKVSTTQKANQTEVAQQGTSSNDAPVELTNPKEARDETPPEILQELLVEKETVYSSSDDTLDENKKLEETLQRKSTRNTRPTLKAKEMQRSGNKGRQGKGRRGRSHR